MIVEEVLNDSITDFDVEEVGKIKVTLTLTEKELSFIIGFIYDGVEDDLNQMWINSEL